MEFLAGMIVGAVVGAMWKEPIERAASWVVEKIIKIKV